MSTPYDIVIIGGGPAGLSAACSIVRQTHSVLILNSGKYRNEDSYIHTLPTWDHRKAGEFRAAARKDLERYGIQAVTYEDAEVTTAEKLDDDLFRLTGADGRTWEGRKLILASGVVDIMPDIEGYAECWISGIFHCLYCHGWEERDVESSGIIAEGDCGSVVVALHIARQALRLSKETTMYTLGNEQLAADIAAAIGATAAPRMKVDARAISKLVKVPERAEVTIHFDDGTTKTEGYMVHKPKTILRGDLAHQLGLELTPQGTEILFRQVVITLTAQGTIKVNPPFNQTSVKGVFAAGDAANPMQTVTQAIFSGTACGGGAPLQLQAEAYGQKALF